MLSRSATMRNSDALRVRNMEKLDLVRASIKPFQQLRQQCMRSVHTASRGHLHSEARRIYSRDKMISREEARYNPEVHAVQGSATPAKRISQSLRSSEQVRRFKQCAIPNLAYKTEQLAFFTQSGEVEADKKERLKERIGQLSRLIVQEKRLISTLTSQQGRHLNETSLKQARTSKIRVDLERAVMQNQIERKEIEELEAQLTALKERKTGNSMVRDRVEEQVGQLRATVNDLRTAIFLQQKERQALRVDLNKIAKAMTNVANEQISEEEKKAELLVYIAKYTVQQEL